VIHGTREFSKDGHLIHYIIQSHHVRVMLGNLIDKCQGQMFNFIIDGSVSWHCCFYSNQRTT